MMKIKIYTIDNDTYNIEKIYVKIVILRNNLQLIICN